MEFDKVIFLDIDGPLATNDCLFGKTFFKFNTYIYMWNPKCCQTLNEILQETDSEIILSSDWRRSFTLDQLKEIFQLNNIIKSPIAVTDTLAYGLSRSAEENRIHQIGRFIENNKINKWVSVDDLNLKCDIVPNFVLVDGENGISEIGIKNQIISFLN